MRVVFCHSCLCRYIFALFFCSFIEIPAAACKNRKADEVSDIGKNRCFFGELEINFLSFLIGHRISFQSAAADGILGNIGIQGNFCNAR